MENNRILSILLVFIFLSLVSIVYGASDNKLTVNSKRVALIIGNASYKNSPLRNPVNDAKDMAAALERQGFDVILKEDASREMMMTAISTFATKQSSGSTNLFYYAGHAMQVNNINYLIPVYNKSTKKGDLEETDLNNFIDLKKEVISQMLNTKDTVNIIILDACRDLPEYLRNCFLSRSISIRPKDGLAQDESFSDNSKFIIFYATSPNSIAADGKGERNSPFTKNLLKYIEKPNTKANDVFSNTTRDVKNETKEKQEPWISQSGPPVDFYFNFETFMKENKQKANRFINNGNGTVTDTNTNLMWASRDNGSYINVDMAKSYCENFHSGGYKDWRMPTMDELKELFDADETYSNDCGESVHLTKLIQLSCTFIWAKTQESDISYFNFNNGKPQLHRSPRGKHRALPVRSGK